MRGAGYPTAVRVALVTRVFWPNVGGIERHVEWLARALHRRGHQVRVVTLDRAFEDGRALPADDVLDGIPVRRIPFRGSTRYPLAPWVLRELGDADVVHVHAVDFLADWLVATKVIHRRPVVLSTHGGFFHTAFASAAKKLWFQSATRAMVAAVDALVCTSDQDAELFGRISGKGVIIRNAVDFSAWEGMIPAPEAGRWINVGRVDVHKGLSNALRTLARVRDLDARPFRFDVFGPEVVPGLGDRLRAEAAGVGLAERFAVHGKVSTEVLHEAVRTAELGLFPAEYESFGLSVVETMGAGLVPVLHDNRAFRYFVDGDTGFLADFLRPEEAARVILRARDLGDERARWSAATRAKALTYGWDGVIPQIEEVYRRVSRGGTR
jgi:alpha-1,3-mannosyltransferase